MKRQDRGFSLLEIALVIAIVSFTVMVSLGVLSQGLNSSRIATEYTLTGIIFEDAYTRLSGQSLVEGPLPISPFYYNESGTFLPPASEIQEQSGKFYRLEIELVKPLEDQLVAAAPGLMGMTMELVWPVDSVSGETLGNSTAKVTQTSMISSLAGPSWSKIDPAFIPRIEL